MAVVEPGKWYITVTCHHCGQRIAVVEDPNQEDKPQPMMFERQREPLTCLLCNRTDEYDVSELQRGRGHPRGRLN